MLLYIRPKLLDVYIAIIWLILGFFLLIKGAEWMVGGSSSLAARLNVSGLIIGLTVVAFGTSAPELVVNVMASVNRHTDIVFGNILGSNNFNLFIILGLVGIIRPFIVQKDTIWKEIPISLVVTLLVFILANGYLQASSDGNTSLSRIDGTILLVTFLLFLGYILMQTKNGSQEAPIDTPLHSLKKSLLLVAIGLTGLVLGGKLVVDNAVNLATSIGISEKVIGLTIVAVGTSLPELVTSVVAALKKQSDMAIGNVIGSNIFNLTLVLGSSALIFPISFNPSFNVEFYLLIGGTLFVLLAMLTGKKKKVDRWEGILLVGVFLLYTIWMIGVIH